MVYLATAVCQDTYRMKAITESIHKCSTRYNNE